MDMQKILYSFLFLSFCALMVYTFNRIITKRKHKAQLDKNPTMWKTILEQHNETLNILIEQGMVDDIKCSLRHICQSIKYKDTLAIQFVEFISYDGYKVGVYTTSSRWLNIEFNEYAFTYNPYACELYVQAFSQQAIIGNCFDILRNSLKYMENGSCNVYEAINKYNNDNYFGLEKLLQTIYRYYSFIKHVDNDTYNSLVEIKNFTICEWVFLPTFVKGGIDCYKHKTRIIVDIDRDGTILIEFIKYGIAKCHLSLPISKVINLNVGVKEELNELLANCEVHPVVLSTAFNETTKIVNKLIMTLPSGLKLEPLQTLDLNLAKYISGK